MAENDIEKISNIDKISQENSGENKLKKQEKTKTTKTTTRKSTTKKSSTTTSNSAEKNTLKVTTSKAKTSKTTANSTTKKSTKTSSNKIKKEDSAKGIAIAQRMLVTYHRIQGIRKQETGIQREFLVLCGCRKSGKRTTDDH